MMTSQKWLDESGRCRERFEICAKVAAPPDYRLLPIVLEIRGFAPHYFRLYIYSTTTKASIDERSR